MIQQTLNLTLPINTSAARFGGAMLDERDVPKMHAQLARVFDVLKHGHWLSLAEIRDASQPGSESATSSRIRDLRKAPFNFSVLTKRGEDGVWRYRLVI